MGSDEVGLVKELVGFLSDAKAEVRKIAVENVAPLTERADCRAVMCSEVALRGLLRCLTDTATSKRALESLVNISHEDDAQRAMVSLRAVPTVATQVIDGSDDMSSAEVDLTCKLLSNLTRWPDAAEQLVKTSPKDRSLDGVRLLQLAQVYVMRGSSATEYDFLAPVFCNVSATECGRDALVRGATKVLATLVPTINAGSVTRRRGIVGCIRNCAFAEDAYAWGLCDDNDVPPVEVDERKARVPLLPHLLPRLVGKGPFRDDEIATLPDYIESANGSAAHEREADDETRTRIVDVISLLCHRRRGRVILREKFVYPVIRELHIFETEKIADKVDTEGFEPPEIMDSIQRVVDALMADEDEGRDEIEDAPEEILDNAEDEVDD